MKESFGTILFISNGALVYLIDSLSRGIWLYALFKSAVVKIVPFILVSATSTGSIGQLHLYSFITLFRYLASETIFSDSPFRKKITGFFNVLPVESCSLFMVIWGHFLRTSSSFGILSYRWIGTLLTRCFLRIASFFIWRLSFSFVLTTSNFVVAYTFLYFKIISTTLSNCSCVRWECWKSNICINSWTLSSYLVMLNLHLKFGFPSNVATWSIVSVFSI